MEGRCEPSWEVLGIIFWRQEWGLGVRDRRET